VVLRPSGGGASIALTGPRSATLAKLSGVEVWVAGTPGAAPGRPLPRRSINVAKFGVRSVDGVPAVDGRLEAEGTQLVLVTADGARHPLVRPPAALRSRVGAHVWIAGPLDRPVTTFGVIEPRATP
jgi:hypothetical protein